MAGYGHRTMAIKASRRARLIEEARMDRAAEALRAEWLEDQRDEEFHRYDDRY